jgi:hypothetical protein
MNNIKRLLINENGQATVMFAICLTALLGITALAVDVGNLYFEKSKMQNALDAGVLAGAHELILTKNDASAEEEADDISDVNGFPLEIHGETASLPEYYGQAIASGVEYYVKANFSKKVNMYFARILGIDNVKVTAKAKAVVRPISGAKGLIPVGIAKNDLPTRQYTDSITLVFPEHEPGPGNFGFLDLDGGHGGGTTDLKNRIVNGYEGTVSIGNLIFTETGGATPGYNAFNERIQKDSGITKCQSAETADFSCHRLVTVPIIETWATGQGKPVRIIGFAVFFIEEMEEKSVSNANPDSNGQGNNQTEKRVTGTFVKRMTQGELDETFDPNKDYGLYGVKLIE